MVTRARSLRPLLHLATAATTTSSSSPAGCACCPQPLWQAALQCRCQGLLCGSQLICHAHHLSLQVLHHCIEIITRTALLLLLLKTCTSSQVVNIQLLLLLVGL
jgi:hypothetical protein